MKFERGEVITHTGHPMSWIQPYSMKKYYDNAALKRGTTSIELTFNPEKNSISGSPEVASPVSMRSRKSTARRSPTKGSPFRTSFSRGQRSDAMSKMSFNDLTIDPLFSINRSKTELSFLNPAITPADKLSPLAPTPAELLNTEKTHLDEILEVNQFTPENPESPKQRMTPPPMTGRKSQRPAGKVCCDYEISKLRCFQCQKKEQQNIYKSNEKERQQKENEEAKRFVDYQVEKDKQMRDHEKELEKERRNANEKIAAFNLEAAMKAKQNKNPDEAVPRAFVFNSRPQTPPRLTKQELYYRDLADQINMRKSAHQKLREDTFMKESKEQAQLADELAADKIKRYHDKTAQQDNYRRALSAQVKSRPPPLPEFLPDSAGQYFAQPDDTDIKEQQKGKNTREMYQQQQDLVQKKAERSAQEKQRQKQDEEEMLRKNRKNLFNDRADQYEMLLNNRKALESNWRKANEEKQEREREEKEHRQKPAKPVHEQCHHYQRCGQCKRDIKNWGESNIWRESRYLPGSKIMV